MKDFRKNLTLAVLLRYIVLPADAALEPADAALRLADAALGPVGAVPAALPGIAARKHFTVPE